MEKVSPVFCLNTMSHGRSKIKGKPHEEQQGSTGKGPETVGVEGMGWLGGAFHIGDPPAPQLPAEATAVQRPRGKGAAASPPPTAAAALAGCRGEEETRSCSAGWHHPQPGVTSRLMLRGRMTSTEISYCRRWCAPCRWRRLSCSFVNLGHCRTS